MYLSEKLMSKLKVKYRVRQRGCSLTHIARTKPAVHPGITIWVDKNEFEKKKKKKKNWLGDFLEGGVAIFFKFFSHFFFF